MRGSIALACGALLICIVASVSADSSRPLGNLVKDLPRDKLSPNISDLDYVSYGTSLAPVVGPGFVLAILSIVVGIIYGIIKICCCICCSSDDDKEFNKYDLKSRLIPAAFYGFFLLFILAGAVIGWVSNGKFDNGLGSLATAVEDTGDSAVGLGRTVIGELQNISTTLPEDLRGILAQISGLPEVTADIANLGVEVNGTIAQLDAIQAQLQNITVLNNITELRNLNSELDALTDKSAAAIGNIVDLTSEISDKLNSVLTDQLANLDSQLQSITDDVAAVIESANDFMKAAEEMVDKIDDYVGQVRNGNDKRSKAMSAIYAAAFVSSAVAVLGWFVMRGFPFHITAGLGFVFSFLLWFSGSVHLLLAIVASDVCGIVDEVVVSFIPDGDAGAAINGCMNDVSLFDALNMTNKFNFSEVRGYQQQFLNFTSFMNTFNFSGVDGYFVSVNSSLSAFNLSATADNLTVEDLGWNPENVYVGLANLNNKTEPENTYGMNNYTDADPNAYPSGSRRDDVRDAKEQLEALVQVNRTTYDTLADTKRQMYATQDSINVLLLNLTTYKQDFDNVQADITNLTQKNITIANNIITSMLDRIQAFFGLGDCSFVHKAYVSILDSICSVMEPAIELLMAGSYMIALGLLPTIILVEVLAKRVPHPSNDEKVYPDDKEYYTYAEEPKAISMGVRTQE